MGVSGAGRRFTACLRVESRGNLSAGPAVYGGQVAGSLPKRQPGTCTRQVREGAVTPSLHPEVPGTQFASPERGLGIRQSMGWTKVCSTARSGIWVPKGNARAHMLPGNLDHLRVGWVSRGSYETAWVTPGHDCLCPYQYGRGAAVRPKTNDTIWDGSSVCGAGSYSSCHLVARGAVPTGVNRTGTPVQDHVSLSTAITNPCSAHVNNLSSQSV